MNSPVIVSVKVINLMKKEIDQLEKTIAKKQARLSALKSSVAQMTPLQGGGGRKKGHGPQ